MTVPSIEESSTGLGNSGGGGMLVVEQQPEEEDQPESSKPIQLSELPEWAQEPSNNSELWGEPLIVPEWEDKDQYRAQNGWKGRDYMHDIHSPVRIVQYFCQYGTGEGAPGFSSGGVGTRLTGICHFTARAESHAGYCHGGSMCSVLDDVVGWCAFLATGTCKPWSGFTVQINTSLKRPITVNSVLLIRAEIVKMERRKVSVRASLVDPAADDAVHAEGEGLVVLNRGVLPLLVSLESTLSTDGREAF